MFDIHTSEKRKEIIQTVKKFHYHVQLLLDNCFKNLLILHWDNKPKLIIKQLKYYMFTQNALINNLPNKNYFFFL